jgi:hypothetical protein
MEKRTIDLFKEQKYFRLCPEKKLIRFGINLALHSTEGEIE